MTIRCATLQKLIDLPYMHLAKYTFGTPDTCLLATNKASCKAMIYGSLTHGLQEQGLWPQPSSPFLNFSVNTMQEKVEDIDINTLGSGDRSVPSTRYNDHSGCSNDKFFFDAETIVQTMDNPVMDAHLRHMRAALAETGSV